MTPAGSPPREDVELRNDTGLLYQSYGEYLRIQHLYGAAVQQLQTRLEVLNDEFRLTHARSPIHHIESRVKSTRSILEKLRRKGCPISMASAMENINDIAGIRVVCGYIDDVYRVEEMLLRQTDMELVRRQDYIAEPNYNGYRSLHLDLRVPVFLSDRTERVLAEVQIRTVAMDFWASLEHDLRYKADPDRLPENINQEMFAAAEQIAAIDRKMQDMFRRISAAEDGEEERIQPQINRT